MSAEIRVVTVKSVGVGLSVIFLVIESCHIILATSSSDLPILFFQKPTHSGDRLLSPLSSLTVLDESGNLRLLVAGVGGGIAGLTGAVFATYRHLWLKELPYEAVSGAVVIPEIHSPSQRVYIY